MVRFALTIYPYSLDSLPANPGDCVPWDKVRPFVAYQNTHVRVSHEMPPGAIESLLQGMKASYDFEH